MRCRSHIPVPGMLTFLYTPLGPTLMLNGAAPSVALRPRAVRFSLTPGSTLKVLRKRQLITIVRRSSIPEQASCLIIVLWNLNLKLLSAASRLEPAGISAAGEDQGEWNRRAALWALPSPR